MPKEKSTPQEQRQSGTLSEGAVVAKLGSLINELAPNEKLEIIKKGFVANSLPVQELKPINNQSNSQNNSEQK